MNNQTSRDRCIKVYNRHENGETYKSIAEDLGISLSRAWQLGSKGKRVLCHRKFIVEHPEHAKHAGTECNSNDILSLGLSPRPYNALWRKGIKEITALTEMTEKELMKVRNIGTKSLVEIKIKLAAVGLELRKENEA